MRAGKQSTQPENTLNSPIKALISACSRNFLPSGATFRNISDCSEIMLVAWRRAWKTFYEGIKYSCFEIVTDGDITTTWLLCCCPTSKDSFWLEVFMSNVIAGKFNRVPIFFYFFYASRIFTFSQGFTATFKSCKYPTVGSVENVSVWRHMNASGTFQGRCAANRNFWIWQILLKKSRFLLILISEF